MAHCNIPSREEKPPSKSSWSTDSSSFALDQYTPSDDLFTASALTAITIIATIATSNNRREEERSIYNHRRMVIFFFFWLELSKTLNSFNSLASASADLYFLFYLSFVISLRKKKKKTFFASSSPIIAISVI